MYQHGHTVTDAPKLPLNLLDALRAFDRDDEPQGQALGDEFSAAYLKLKQAGMEQLRVPLHAVGARQHARRLAAGDRAEI